MKRIIAFAYIIFLAGTINAQSPSLNAFSERISLFRSEFNTVKTLVKTDKDVYAPGETIWFEVRVLNCLNEKAHGNTSLVLMLKSESGEIIADRQYRVEKGSLWGSLEIPSWTTGGNAFFIAYTSETFQKGDASLAAIHPISITRLNRNNFNIIITKNKSIYKPGDQAHLNIRLNAITPTAKRERVTVSLHSPQNIIHSIRENMKVNENHEFKFEIPSNQTGLYLEVSTDNMHSRRIQIPTTHDAVNVEFFAEGGKIISNINQRIIYRAFDPFGNPINVSGKIYDQQNNLAGDARYLRNGIGVVNLMPMPNKTYTLRIDSEYGNKQQFNLPPVNTEGVSLTLSKTEDSALRFAVYNSKKYHGQNLTLAAYAAGEIHMSEEYAASTRNDFNIATQKLPHGVVNLIVLSQNGKILSERMIYNPAPEPKFNLKINADEQTVKINLPGDSLLGAENIISLGLTVSDKQMLVTRPELNYDHLKYPLVHSPPETVLEHFMCNTELIANQYKTFTLSQIIGEKNHANSKQQNSIVGVVYNRRNRPVGNASVMLNHPERHSLITVKTNENGEFRFENIPWHSQMSISAVSENGRRKYDVELDRYFSNTMEELLLRESLNRKHPFENRDTPKYIEDNLELLKQAGTETQTSKIRHETNTEKLLQSGISLLEVIRIIKPYNIVNNQIVFHGSINSLSFQQGALIIIDGQRMGTSLTVLESINPAEVESIKVSTNFADIQQYSGVNSVGVIEIRTMGVNDKDLTQSSSETKSKTRFDLSTIDSQIRSYQTTLLWEPYIDLIKHQAMEIEMPLSHIKTEFAVIFDITTADGITFRKIKTFSTAEIQ